MKKSLVVINLVTILALAAGQSAAQGGMSQEERMKRVERLLAAPNPLEPGDSVWIEELTYMESARQDRGRRDDRHRCHRRH